MRVEDRLLGARLALTTGGWLLHHRPRSLELKYLI